jgi:transcriptional regulator with GAF, ATPase, and Fis domain
MSTARRPPRPNPAVQLQNDLEATGIDLERARPETSPSRSDALRRADAEHYRVDVERLFQFTAAINRAAGIEAVHSIALRALCETLNVDRAAILLLDPDGIMRFKAWRGLSDRYREAVEGHTPWALDDPDPQPVTVRDAAADPAMASFHELFRDEDIHALAFIPLIDQRLWGKLMVYSRESRAFTEREIAHGQVIASLISQALARAQLLEAERWARGQAELAQKRTAFLLEASIALSSSLEFQEALERVAHLAVPGFADWCAVDFSPEGPSSIHHVALVHRDPAKRLID